MTWLLCTLGLFCFPMQYQPYVGPPGVVENKGTSPAKWITFPSLRSRSRSGERTTVVRPRAEYIPASYWLRIERCYGSEPCWGEIVEVTRETYERTELFSRWY